MHSQELQGKSHSPKPHTCRSLRWNQNMQLVQLRHATQGLFKEDCLTEASQNSANEAQFKAQASQDGAAQLKEHASQQTATWNGGSPVVRRVT